MTVSRRETKCLFPLTKVLVGKIESIEKRMSDSHPCALISLILKFNESFQFNACNPNFHVSVLLKRQRTHEWNLNIASRRLSPKTESIIC